MPNNGGLDEADFGQAVSVRAVYQPCSVHHPFLVPLSGEIFSSIRTEALMPATIAYDPNLSQKAREYLIQLEDYLKELNPCHQDVRDVLLYLNKLITIHASIGEVTRLKVKTPE